MRSLAAACITVTKNHVQCNQGLLLDRKSSLLLLKKKVK